MDLARCWQLLMQAIPASLLGKLVKLSNMDFRNAIRSISHWEASPVMENIGFQAFNRLDFLP